MKIGYYNGVMGPVESVMIPMQDRAMYFGDGVYDFIFAYNGIMYGTEDHIDRFYNSMKMMEIHPRCSREELRKELQKCLDASEIKDGAAVYWQTSRGNCARNHIFPKEGEPSTLLITVSPLKTPDWNKPLKLVTVEDTRFQHCNIKSLNLIPNVMAAQRAEEAGCQEAVFHRGDQLMECAHSALAIIKDGHVIAPVLNNLILPSISRKHVYEICEELGIPAESRPVTMQEVMDADEIMVLSTSKLMMPADTIDGKPVGMKDRELFDRIRNRYFEKVKEVTGYTLG
ncbi:MAG: aminotransferase class IV [Solobacterium sp.]|nr:aminotransferase class IV [Solobacterium sp.]